MSSADEILLAQPMAKAMLEAGVPRDEVIAGLRPAAAQATRTAQPAAQEPDDAPLQTRSHSFGAPLPPGWEERFDPSSGRKFYVDYVNKSTSWTRPTAAAPASSGASAVSTEEHATPWSAIPSTGVAYPRMSARDRAETAPARGVAALIGGSEAAPPEEGRPRSGTGASDSPAGDREGKKKKGLFSGWGGDPEKKRAEKEARAREEVERRAERDRAKEEVKALAHARAEEHARELAELAERERLVREAREDERWRREREAEEARRLEREATERERRRNLPQTSESLLATLCDGEAAPQLGTAGGLHFDTAEKTGAADTLAAMLATDAAALGAMRSTEAPLRLLDALGSASDTGLQASATRPLHSPRHRAPARPPARPPARARSPPHAPPCHQSSSTTASLTVAAAGGVAQPAQPPLRRGRRTAGRRRPRGVGRPPLPHRAALAPRIAPAARAGCRAPRRALRVRPRHRRLPRRHGWHPAAARSRLGA